MSDEATGPRQFKKCSKCGGRLKVTATEETPDGKIERNKRCQKCGLDHLDTEAT